MKHRFSLVSSILFSLLLARLSMAELAVPGSGVARMAALETLVGADENVLTVNTSLTDNVSITYFGDRVCRQAVIEMEDVPIVVVYGGSGTNSLGSTQLATFPEGRILVHGVVVDNHTLTVGTGLAVSDGGDFGFGTAAGAAADLTGTAVDLCPKTSIDPVTNITDSALAVSAQFDGTATANTLNYNLLIDADDIANDTTNTVSGTVSLLYSVIGDD